MEYKETYQQRTPYGLATAVDDGDWVWIKANDFARLLLFRNPREAVKAYCREAKFFKVQTNGGIQPTKFINYLDQFRLQIKSNHPDAEGNLVKEHEELTEDSYKYDELFDDFLEEYNENLDLKHTLSEFKDSIYEILKTNSAILDNTVIITEIVKKLNELDG